MTPHQRRTRELEALQRLIADCQSYVDLATPTPTAALAATFEQHTSLLPATSELRGQLESLALKLRRAPSPVIAEANLRRVLTRLRQKTDDLGRWVEARDTKLRERVDG